MIEDDDYDYKLYTQADRELEVEEWLNQAIMDDKVQ